MAARQPRAQLNKPVDITIDAAGNVYVADTNNSRIRKIFADGTITTIAGMGGANYSGDGGRCHLRVAELPAQHRGQLQRHGLYRRYRQLT